MPPPAPGLATINEKVTAFSMATTEILYSGLISATASSDSITTPTPDPTGRSGTLNLARYREIVLFVQLKTLTGGAAPTVQVFVASGDGQSGGSQQWNTLTTPPAAWTAAPSEYFASCGPGLDNNHSLGIIGHIAWLITGAPTGCTFFVTIYGKL